MSILFADKFRKLLEEKNLKQKDIADAFPEYTFQAVNRWYKGKSRPNYEDLKKLSQMLQVSIDDLLENDVTWLGNDIIDPKSKTIPLINWVQAGKPTDIQPNCIDEHVAVPKDIPDECFALVVQGNSMEPNFLSGDILIVDPTIQPTTGHFVIAVTDGYEKATFKKFRERFDENGQMYFELVPLNIDYPIFTSKQFPIHIIGVVRSFIRKVNF